LSYKIKRIVPILCLTATLFAVTLLPVSGYCENLRFVVLGDSPVGTPPGMVNTVVLTPILNQIVALSPQPSFVVFTGDQATCGIYQGTNNFEAFKSAMAPLTNAGIPFYTALGNRELYNPKTSVDDTFYFANQTAYQAAFTGNPANGPAGYERLVYSFTSPGGDAFFAVMDPYYLTADVSSPDVTGTFDKTQLDWLTARVAETRATHKFLFVHGPCYYVTSPEGGADPPDITYTKLWQILDNNRFDLYCCGHVHLYSRKTIDSSISPSSQFIPPIQWHHNVVQLQDGTAGAPIVSDTPVVNPALWHISQTVNTYYFSVVDISGSLVTVNTYSYNSDTAAFSISDTFTINKAPVSGINFLLLD
jgi:hypothetical protein